MGSMSGYLEGKVLDHLMGATVYTTPATVYLALYSVTPSAAGGGTEATGAGYARLAITNNTTNWPAASGTAPSSKSNGTTLTMATATGDWSSASNMVAWGLFDAVSAGNLLWWGALTEAKPVLNGDTMSFAVGAFTLQLT